MEFERKRNHVQMCPCGKSNRDGKFAPFAGQTEYGYCHSCNKTFYPNDPKPANDGQLVNRQFANKRVDNSFSTIDFDVMKQSLVDFESNHFITYLKTLFDSDTVNDLIATYFISTNHARWRGSTVWWYIDNKGRVRGGKVMLYNAITGKRVKEPFSHIGWVHTTLGLKGFNFRRCFFGLHLIDKPENRNKPIAIVESEKTAIIASGFLPNFIWLASGGKSCLTFTALETLKGREIHLFPDANSYEAWYDIANKVANEYNIYVSDLLENSLSDAEKAKGYDIVDYLITLRVQTAPTATRDYSKYEKYLTKSITDHTPQKENLDRIETSQPVETIFYPFEHEIYAPIRPKYPQCFDEKKLIDRERKANRKKGLFATDLRFFDFETLLTAFGLKDALAHVEHQTRIHEPERYVLYPSYLTFINRLTQPNA